MFCSMGTASRSALRARVPRRARARAVWYAKYRLPDGRQVQKKIGPAWTERGRPPAGYFTKRLAEAGCGTCSTRRGAGRCRAWCGPAPRSPTPRPSGCATSSTTAAASRRPSRATESIVRAQLLPAFGAMPLESITTAMIERWLGSRRLASALRGVKASCLLHGILQRARKV